MTTMPNDLSAFWMPFTDNRGYKAEPAEARFSIHV